MFIRENAHGVVAVLAEGDGNAGRISMILDQAAENRDEKIDEMLEEIGIRYHADENGYWALIPENRMATEELDGMLREVADTWDIHVSELQTVGF